MTAVLQTPLAITHSEHGTPHRSAFFVDMHPYLRLTALQCAQRSCSARVPQGLHKNTHMPTIPSAPPLESR